MASVSNVKLDSGTGKFFAYDNDLVNLVTAETNPLTGVIRIIWTGTQAQYDAISAKDDETLYVIVG